MKCVAIILAFYIFLGSLFPLMDFSQMAKVMSLWQHYDLHQSEVAKGGEATSFASFWTQHYLQVDDHTHPQESEHQNLPLTQIQNGGYFLPSKNIFPQVFIPHTLNLQSAINESLPSFDSFKSLFRPPITS